jgi:hypothetical protein
VNQPLSSAPCNVTPRSKLKVGLLSQRYLGWAGTPSSTDLLSLPHGLHTEALLLSASRPSRDTHLAGHQVCPHPCGVLRTSSSTKVGGEHKKEGPSFKVSMSALEPCRVLGAHRVSGTGPQVFVAESVAASAFGHHIFLCQKETHSPV